MQQQVLQQQPQEQVVLRRWTCWDFHLYHCVMFLVRIHKVVVTMSCYITDMNRALINNNRNVVQFQVVVQQSYKIPWWTHRLNFQGHVWCCCHGAHIVRSHAKGLLLVWLCCRLVEQSKWIFLSQNTFDRTWRYKRANLDDSFGFTWPMFSKGDGWLLAAAVNGNMSDLPL